MRLPTSWAPMAAAALLLSGCQTSASFEHGSLPAFTSDPLESAPPVARGLDASGLSTLLGAELAGLRGDYRFASHNYLAAAQRYGAPALAERATFAARFSNDPGLIEASALRWRELSPQAETPNQLLAALSMQRGDWMASLEQRLTITEAGGYGDLATFAEIAASEEAPLEPLLARLYTHLDAPGAETLEHHDDALLATALLEAASGELPAAQTRLQGLMQSDPENPALWYAKGQLALESGDNAGARQAAREGLELAPDDVRFILLLAQAEIRLNNIEAAEAQTDALLESYGASAELRLALAQLYLEEGHPEPAHRLLHAFIGQPDIPNLAYYLLGSIEQMQGDTDTALLYYRQVGEGDEFLPSRATAARMLIDEDRFLDARAFLRIERMRSETYFNDLLLLEIQLLDEQGRSADADALLDRELARTPDDSPLLYLRAMRAWEAGNLEAMETDLRRILQKEPNNALALNALGFTLADANQPERLDEARELIERAYTADPNNPAVLDSMGWVYYRQGQPEEALPWLESAYARMPDQEIAAHLAEVLHALGRSEEARQLLDEFMQRVSDHPLIDELLLRFPELMPAGLTSEPST